MGGHFRGIVVDEMPHPVMRNAAMLGPFAQRADRWFVPPRENPAETKTDNVGEARVAVGSIDLLFHTGVRRVNRRTFFYWIYGASKTYAVAARLGTILKNSSASAALFRSR